MCKATDKYLFLMMSFTFISCFSSNPVCCCASFPSVREMRLL